MMLDGNTLCDRWSYFYNEATGQDLASGYEGDSEYGRKAWDRLAEALNAQTPQQTSNPVDWTMRAAAANIASQVSTTAYKDDEQNLLWLWYYRFFLSVLKGEHDEESK